MKIALFCHSLLSDWNHGNAHFLRGIVAELCGRGHQVRSYEAADAWSAANLTAEHGEAPLDELRRVYPQLDIHRYEPERLDLDQVLDGVDLALVHEWNEPELVAAVGRARSRGAKFTLLFHDTHHRSITEPDAMQRFDLSAYDAVLAFGEAVRQQYLRRGWSRRVFTWHEGADVRRFKPLPDTPKQADLVWIGNWGDEERTRELYEFLLDPVQRLRLRATVHGVRYPEEARAALARAGLTYGGWLPNYRVPETFAAHRVTVHVPRRPYASALPGIPTIRVFEALACGIPLVSAPWSDDEALFDPGDFLLARSGREMSDAIAAVLNDARLAADLARRGRQAILARHTCGHRVDQLLQIARRLAEPKPDEPSEQTHNTTVEVA
ncbi:MAG TPA: glycosyltransferase [Polyangiaceae bacterium]|nr:glycosyltransferase [Polyangiaceae bacterium]